jgi:hypothetical protein
MISSRALAKFSNRWPLVSGESQSQKLAFPGGVSGVVATFRESK